MPAHSNLSFAAYVARPERDIDLAEASLRIAAEIYPALDIGSYIAWLDAQGERARERLSPSGSPPVVIAEFNRLIFDELGFHANVEQYYDARNSYLNEVIERRTGIPITLSLVYIEIGTRAGLRMEGVGLPGHFVVRAGGPNWEVLLDPFNRGTELTRYDCEQLLAQTFGRTTPLQPHYLLAVSKRAFLLRILTNLQVVYMQDQRWTDALRAIQNGFSLKPDTPAAAELTRARGLVHYKLEQWGDAERDWLQYMLIAPDAPDAALIRENLDSLRAMIARRN
jgi:regulator of sirC expression with transglutaminase-like and TPR domain